MSFTKKLAIISMMIALINGQKWYTASIVENDVTIRKATNPNRFQDTEDNFLPLPILIPRLNDTSKENLLVTNNNMLKNKNKYDKLTNQRNITNIVKVTIKNETGDQIIEDVKLKPQSSLQNNTIYHKKMQSVVWFNNTMANDNVIRNPIPKRKIVRQCPSMRPRQKKQLYPEPKGKFLDVFHVVQFENVPCTSSNGLDGVCLHQFECDASGGSPMGQCADGYGACCVTQFSCGDGSKSQSGWFINPGFPSPSTDRLSCSFTLNKASTDVTQVRLDFLHFELLPPNSGTCEEDQFIISGQNINNFIPILCGINNDQHIYVEVRDGIEINVQTISEENRLFAIKFTQLTPFDDMAAPKGCLQYHRDSNGRLESFNFQEESTVTLPKFPSYLNNLNYAMCIERSSDACSITYTNAGDMQIFNYDTDGFPLIPLEQAGVEIFNCPNDWLLMAAARLCGDRLNDGSIFQDFSVDAPITDFSQGPIIVWFRSDGGYVGRGFRIEYTQNPCLNPA